MSPRPSAARTIEELLGADGPHLLGHRCETVPADLLQLMGPDFVDRVVAKGDRGNRVLSGLRRLFDHGRLGGSGYLSILPVDQGIEHSTGASFAPIPAHFDPERLVELARPTTSGPTTSGSPSRRT